MGVTKSDFGVEGHMDSRPAEYFDRFHERTRTGNPDYIYPLTRLVLTGGLLLGFRLRTIGRENVPATGPVILAPNHFSFFDHFLIAVNLRRKVRFMAKSELFKWPLDYILSHGGSFPVLRKRHDQEAIKTAFSILNRGQLLAMYAEGTRSSSGKVEQPKRGLGRIVLQSGAPVVPVAIHGTEKAKRMKKLAPPGKVTVQYDMPVQFEKAANPTPERAAEVSEAIFERIRAMHDRLNSMGRKAVLKASRQVAAHS